MTADDMLPPFSDASSDASPRGRSAAATMRRRRFLGLFAAAPAAISAAPGFAAPSEGAPVTRRFRVLRGDDEIGTQTITVRRTGDETVAEVKIDIAVTVLGLTVYRYRLDSRETWRGGRLMALDATCDDDGTAEYVTARAEGDVLMVDGSGHQGPVPGDVAPTSYWSREFLNRPVWISTQSGAPLNVSTRRTGGAELPTAAGALQVEEWQVSGDLDLTLFRTGGQFVGTRFEAKGETGLIAPETVGDPLPELPVA